MCMILTIVMMSIGGCGSNAQSHGMYIYEDIGEGSLDEHAPIKSKNPMIKIFFIDLIRHLK